MLLCWMILLFQIVVYLQPHASLASLSLLLSSVQGFVPRQRFATSTRRIRVCTHKMTSTDAQAEEDSTNAPSADGATAAEVLPPVYITIGPPCAGKTTLLKKLQFQHNMEILDVALDDQPNVYISVPTSFYVQQHGKSNPNLWNSSIQNKTIANRILGGEDEMRAVLQRLGGLLSKEEFQERIQQIYKDQLQQRQVQQQQHQQYSSPAINSNATVNATHSNSIRQAPQKQDSETTSNSSEKRNETKSAAPVPNETSNMTSTTTNATDAVPVLSRHALQLQERLQQQRLDSRMVARELIQAVEAILQKQVSLPDLVDLFVVESLFRPVDGMTGVERAQELFQNASVGNTAIAWGNTNTKPRDYRVALDIAFQSKRPVHFLVYNCFKDNCMDLEENEQHVMPRQPLSVLLQRNLNRLLEKGKYIPAQTIFDSSQRIENLMQSALLELQRPYKQQEQEKHHKQQAEDTEKEVVVEIKDSKVEKDTMNANRTGGDDSELTQDKQNTSESSPLQDDDGSRIAPPKFSKFDLDRILCQMVQYKLEPNRTVTPITDGRDGRKRQRQASGGGRGRNIKRGRFSNSGRSTWQQQQPQGRRPYGASRYDANAFGQQQQPQRNRGDRQYSQQTRRQQHQPSSWHQGRNQRNAGEYRRQDVQYDTTHGNRTGYGRDSGNYRGGGYHRQQDRRYSRGGNRNATAASGRGGYSSSRNRQEEYDGSGRGGGRWQGGYRNPRDHNNRTNMDRGSWQQEQQQDGRESRRRQEGYSWQQQQSGEFRGNAPPPSAWSNPNATTPSARNTNYQQRRQEPS